jgi:hypothetical protein
LLYYFACPNFIREYRDFGEYDARKHSHRWIIWEFYHNLKRLSGWKSIVKETSSKGLTIAVDELPRQIIEHLPPEFIQGESIDELKVFSPVNIDRDIYLLITTDGNKLALPIREADPELAKKERELFWILYSQAAKERPVLRGMYWALVGTAVALLFGSALLKIKCLMP